MTCGQSRAFACVCGCLALTVVAATAPSARQHSGGDRIIISVPPQLPIVNCEVQYLLTGPFGGVAMHAKWNTTSSAYEIPTVHDGVPAVALKAFLHCPGYHTETITLPSLSPATTRSFRLTPRRLGTIALHGVVRGLPPGGRQSASVDVAYLASWICEFFGLVDCMLPFWPTAAAPLQNDGTFSVALPDVRHDSGLAPFRDAGEFVFRLVDSKNGKVLYELEAKGEHARSARFPVRATYPGTVTFEAQQPR